MSNLELSPEETTRLQANVFPVVVRDGVVVPFNVLQLGLDMTIAKPVARELIQFALNQLGQNCAAGAKKAAGDGASEGAINAKARELWGKRAATLAAGEWTTRAPSSPGLSPVEKEARNLAQADIIARANLPLRKRTDKQESGLQKAVDATWKNFVESAEKIIAQRAIVPDAALATDLAEFFK